MVEPLQVGAGDLPVRDLFLPGSEEHQSQGAAVQRAAVGPEGLHAQKGEGMPVHGVPLLVTHEHVAPGGCAASRVSPAG